MSTGGHIPSTLSDVLRFVRAIYAHPSVTPAWVLGAAYTAGTQAASDGRVYTCFSPGVALTAPTGPGSQSDANGTGWYPLFFEGERFDESEGAPPRIWIVQSKSGSGSKLGPVLEIGARQLGSITEACVCYVWGAETVENGDRYDAAKAMILRLVAAFNAAAVGRLEYRRLERGDQTSLVTYGEEYQLEIAYTWAVPRDGAVDTAAAALAEVGGYSQAPPDPDRPGGGTGSTFKIAVEMQDTRTEE